MRGRDPLYPDGVPSKTEIPGFTIRFDRWSRSWIWKRQSTGEIKKNFRTRNDAAIDAHEILRASRASNPEQ